MPANNPEQTVNDMVETMIKLACDRDLRKRMGEAAQKRVAEHLNG